jgi:hypothetical protein
MLKLYCYLGDIMAQSFFLEDWRKKVPPCRGIADAIKRGSNAAREDAEAMRKSREARFKRLFELEKQME